MNFYRLLGVAVLCIYLAGCGSTSTSPSSQAQTNTPQGTVIVELNEESQIDKIESNYNIDNNTVTRNTSLLALANQYAQVGECNSANIIIKYTQESIKVSSNQALANILKSECALNYLQQVHELMYSKPYYDNINRWLNDITDTSLEAQSTIPLNTDTLLARREIAKARLSALQQDYESAVRSILMLKTDSSVFLQDDTNNQLWNWFSLLDIQSRQNLRRSFPQLQEFENLLAVIEDKSISDRVRRETLNEWLINHPDSASAINTPSQLRDYLSLGKALNTQREVAVLLPLSGRLANQGSAIKQGLLASYYQKLATAKNQNSFYKVKLQFIDTGSSNTLNPEINQNQLAQYDTVIGPLLRTHIEAVKPLLLPHTQQLALNFIASEQSEKNPQFAMFSLSPEQEARQLVKLIRQNSISKPVVVSSNSNAASRMSDAFITAWQESEIENEQNASIQKLTFSDNESMRVGITSALDVLQSQKRISQVSNLSSDRIISVTRNRRDVDAFVVFAKPDEIELINPIIESSISLFSGEHVPVYATSYSYDHKQNKNTQRDLRNLIFTDMPWVLPTGRESVLSNSVDSLFNEPPTGFLRLFAFGYDALSLIDNLSKLNTFSHMSISGLSGELRIDDRQQVDRELPFLVINDQVESD